MRAQPAESIAPDEAIALSHLQDIWAAAYTVRFERGKYRAEFHYDDIDIQADTLAGLDSALRAHWHRTWGASSVGGTDWVHWSAE